jgi:hypothetical protein
LKLRFNDFSPPESRRFALPTHTPPIRTPDSGSNPSVRPSKPDPATILTAARFPLMPEDVGSAGGDSVGPKGDGVESLRCESAWLAAMGVGCSSACSDAGATLAMITKQTRYARARCCGAKSIAERRCYFRKPMLPYITIGEHCIAYEELRPAALRDPLHGKLVSPSRDERSAAISM